MTAPRRIRVGFLNTHPIQYAAPLYRHINQSPDIEAVPIYLTDHSLRGAIDQQFGQKVTWDVDLIGGTDPVFVAGYETRQVRTGVLAMPAWPVWSAVRGAKLDALVIFGHVQFANHLAMLAARSRGIPVFYRAETHLGLDRTRLKQVLRRIVMGLYTRLPDGFLAIGSLNRAYYRAMGVSEQRIFDLPYAVDNQRIADAARLTEAERGTVRDGLGLRRDVPVIVYASKLTRRKHPGDLIAAAAMLRREGHDFDLLFVGSGEMEDELRAAADDVPGAPPVFAGFRNQAELPRLLGASDIFVLPSENEPWGLIINEAMAAGLAIVTSREVGAVPDLVHEGVNGALFEAGDVAELADALRPLVTDAALIRRMGGESREMIARWGYAEDLIGLRAALRAARLLPA